MNPGKGDIVEINDYALEGLVRTRLAEARAFAATRALVERSRIRDGISSPPECIVRVEREGNMENQAVHKQILVGLDDVREAAHIVPWVRRLAENAAARVHLLLVRPSAPWIVAGGRTIAYEDEIESQTKTEGLDALRRIAAPLEAEGLIVPTEVRFGDAADTILATAREKGADLIAVTIRRPNGVRRLWARSVAEDVLRRSPVPVLVSRADGQAAA